MAEIVAVKYWEAVQCTASRPLKPVNSNGCYRNARVSGVRPFYLRLSELNYSHNFPVAPNTVPIRFSKLLN